MRWSENDIEFLKENYSSVDSLNNLGKKLGKSKKAIKHKAARLGLSRGRSPINKPKDQYYRKEADKRYYQNNREKIYSLKMDRIRKRKEMLVGKMGGKCSKCGYNKCIAALDFHHKGQDKEGDLSRMIKDYSEQKALKEIEKCILICANCHRELHNQGP